MSAPAAGSRGARRPSAGRTAPCLVCSAPVDPFLSFGPMPIANGFLTAGEVPREELFELAVGACPRCAMVQLTERIDPAKLFHGQYAYFSSVSTRMTEHFRLFAESVRAAYASDGDPFVVEIGSNDGILLQNFARANVRHLGVEPSANVARAASERGVRTVCRFFDESAGEDLRREHGPADVVLGANVVCHLPGLPSVVRGIQALLSERGVFVFEEPYWGDILRMTSYDQIYDEHYFYFSLHSLSRLFDGLGMEVVDVAPQSVHGGSMRYTAARRGARPVAASVSRLKAAEAEMNLADPASCDAFRDRVHRSREALVALLGRRKGEGRRIMGYGATSKSTTVTNFCGIGPDLVESICDTTPGKQGRLSPGAHIPVVPYERFVEDPPDDALLFAWNHADEILEKERSFRSRGGAFLVYVPEVKILRAPEGGRSDD